MPGPAEGRVPGIHVLQRARRKTWMRGTSPRMTTEGCWRAGPSLQRSCNRSDHAGAPPPLLPGAARWRRARLGGREHRCLRRGVRHGARRPRGAEGRAGAGAGQDAGGEVHVYRVLRPVLHPRQPRRALRRRAAASRRGRRGRLGARPDAARGRRHGARHRDGGGGERRRHLRGQLLHPGQHLRPAHPRRDGPGSARPRDRGAAARARARGRRPRRSPRGAAHPSARRRARFRAPPAGALCRRQDPRHARGIPRHGPAHQPRPQRFPAHARSRARSRQAPRRPARPCPPPRAARPARSAPHAAPEHGPRRHALPHFLEAPEDRAAQGDGAVRRSAARSPPSRASCCSSSTACTR